MNLGAMLGDAQQALYEVAERQEREDRKKARKAKEAEQNRRRSRGELIRYTQRDR